MRHGTNCVDEKANEVLKMLQASVDLWCLT